MPGKRPRQIQRTTSMSQLGGAAGGIAMGAARFSQTAPGNFYGEAGHPFHGGVSTPLKQDLSETMEVCTGTENTVSPRDLMEDNFNSMAIDDGVEESLYASHAVRPVVLQANDLGVPNQSLHPGYLLHPSPNKVMTPQSSLNKGHEAGRSAQPGHFLDVCNLCSKRLGHGRDVFIYRGDRAFCSVECRHSQIVADEMRENCGMAAAKEGTASNTPARNPPSTKQVETAAAA